MAAAWLLAVALGLAAVLALILSQDGRRSGDRRSAADGRIPFGILGDSDSAAYQDSVAFPANEPQPGGAYHAITLQWPEVLARMRVGQVDLGEWAVWGVSRGLSFARIRDGLGLPWRGPQRETNQHNLAWPCDTASLTTGAWRQTQRLVDVMNERPDWWRDGVVVIRSGVNDFGKVEALDILARNPDEPNVLAVIESCVRHIRAAVGLIHDTHPQTRIVIVGILNNADWPPYFSRWQSAEQQRCLNRGLDHFDVALRALADADERLAFFDDRAWFASHWGCRNATTGKPDYRAVPIGGKLSVSNTMGDSPDHAVLGNGHAGLVWNVLWVQALVELVRTQFAIPIDPIADSEVVGFVAASVAEMDKLRTDGR